MPDSPLPEVAAFQMFRRGRIWVFANTAEGSATSFCSRFTTFIIIVVSKVGCSNPRTVVT